MEVNKSTSDTKLDNKTRTSKIVELLEKEHSTENINITYVISYLSDQVAE